MSNQRILITGADGYIGSKLTRLFLDDGSYSLILWVRADSTVETEEKQTRLLDQYDKYRDKIQIATGNFGLLDPYSGIDPSEVTHIINCAAVIRFNVEEDLANSVNRDGMLKLLTFSRKCANLERFVQLSTLYASGLAEGRIKEEIFDVSGPFANHYERSKCEAENILVQQFDDIPWQILRLATVISDTDAGSVSQYNVFHNTMQLLYHGLISLIPGDPDVPLYFVTGEFSSRAIHSIVKSDYQPHGIYNICHLEEESITLQALLDCCFEVFSEDKIYRKRKVLKPLLTDLETFKLLGEGLAGLSAKMVSEAVGSILPFAPQLYIRKSFDNSNLQKVLPDYNAPDPNTLAENIVRYLLTTQWGKKIESI